MNRTRRFCRIVMMFILLTSVSVGWTSCPNKEWFPTTGKWYCEELGALISFDDHLESYFTVDGVQYPCAWGNNRGSTVCRIVLRSEEGYAVSDEEFFRGELVYIDDERFVVENINKDEFTFVKVE